MEAAREGMDKKVAGKIAFQIARVEYFLPNLVIFQLFANFGSKEVSIQIFRVALEKGLLNHPSMIEPIASANIIMVSQTLEFHIWLLY